MDTHNFWNVGDVDGGNGVIECLRRRKSKKITRNEAMYTLARLFVTFLIFYSCTGICIGYRPVFIVHGIMSQNKTMINLSAIINQFHPGTKTYVFSRYCGWDSLLPLSYQAAQVGPDLLSISALHPEGFHLIGYSQGGLLARAILELFPSHRVRTFVSLSSPQAGQYGTNMLKKFFPHLIKEAAYKLFYTSAGQSLSVANYWNDPHKQELYYEYNNFLPVINNEKLSPSDNSSWLYRKTGITKLRAMVLIGGPDDGIIEPWQSSHFAYYDANETVVPVSDQKFFINDDFGLKTLFERKALYIFNVSGVGHHCWHRNVTVIKNYILPFLD